MTDPVITDSDLYRVVFENDRVRVLEYRDAPGDSTHLHSHPDSVMVTLSSFSRVISDGTEEVPVQLDAATVRWLDAQQHLGRNVGTTPTHAVFIELKQSGPARTDSAVRLGPSTN